MHAEQNFPGVTILSRAAQLFKVASQGPNNQQLDRETQRYINLV